MPSVEHSGIALMTYCAHSVQTFVSHHTEASYNFLCRNRRLCLKNVRPVYPLESERKRAPNHVI